MADKYTIDERSKAVRLAKRATYDKTLVHSILNQSPILHVSFNAPTTDPSEPQFPTILPMLGATGIYPPTSSSDNDSSSAIYLHGSSIARLFKLTSSGALPICVAATLVDGYVLALAPFHNSCNYRSAVAFGHGELVTDADEIEYALTLITNNSIPARWENSRSQATKAELIATGILKVVIETASAKVRTGGPGDDRADMHDAALTVRTWVGVVPMYSVLGTPIAAEHNKVGRVPEYLEDWVADVNSLNEQQAVNAVDG